MAEDNAIRLTDETRGSFGKCLVPDAASYVFDRHELLEAGKHIFRMMEVEDGLTDGRYSESITALGETLRQHNSPNFSNELNKHAT